MKRRSIKEDFLVPAHTGYERAEVSELHSPSLSFFTDLLTPFSFFEECMGDDISN